ncbi:MAG: phosphatase PAP2 family protein [Candidatus Aenigmarchaeota archaeon]|nr:phosphatase PAP2 family protein [Candidatus Aenigmarchaeota archaeon]
MDILGIWYVVTVLGAPEYWGFATLGLIAVYFALRYMIPENPNWKKVKPAFKKFLLVFVPSIALFFVLTLSIKTFWFVQRPCLPCPAAGCNPFCDLDSSFPSGHSGTIFVAFSSFYLAFRKRMKKDGLSRSYKAVNPRSLLLLFILPVLVSFSRIALGVHTWIDVLAGAFLGLVIPFIVSIIMQKKYKSR